MIQLLIKPTEIRMPATKLGISRYRGGSDNPTHIVYEPLHFANCEEIYYGAKEIHVKPFGNSEPKPPEEQEVGNLDTDDTPQENDPPKH